MNIQLSIIFKPTCLFWSGHERSEVMAHKESVHLLQTDHEVLALLLYVLDRVPWFPESLRDIMKESDEVHFYLLN